MRRKLRVGAIGVAIAVIVASMVWLYLLYLDAARCSNVCITTTDSTAYGYVTDAVFPIDFFAIGILAIAFLIPVLLWTVKRPPS